MARETWWVAPVFPGMPNFPSLTQADIRRWSNLVGTEIDCSFADANHTARVEALSPDSEDVYRLKLSIEFPEGDHLPGWINNPNVWWTIAYGPTMRLIYRLK